MRTLTRHSKQLRSAWFKCAGEREQLVDAHPNIAFPMPCVIVLLTCIHCHPQCVVLGGSAFPTARRTRSRTTALGRLGSQPFRPRSGSDLSNTNWCGGTFPGDCGLVHVQIVVLDFDLESLCSMDVATFGLLTAAEALYSYRECKWDAKHRLNGCYASNIAICELFALCLSAALSQ